MKPILDFTDKPNQKAFYFDRSRSIGGFGGFNSGKSYVAAAKLNTNLEIFAGSRAIAGRKTYGAMEKSVRETFLEIVKKRNGGTLNSGPVIKRYSENELEYQNGSILWFTSYDEVQKVRGPNLAFAWISQAEEVSFDIYSELFGRVRQWNAESIAEFKEKHGPALKAQFGVIPTPFNQLMCEGNPAPNWVRDQFHYNVTGENKCYQIPTIENKKYQDSGWLEAMKKQHSKEWYDRYILGSWETFGGAVYPEFDIGELHGISDMRIPDNWPRIVGWDHGYRNPTAIEVGAVDEVGNIVIYKEHYRDNETVKNHAAAFHAMAKDDKFPVGNNDKFTVFMDYGVKGTYDQDGKTIWDEYSNLGIFGLNPDKDVNAGINMVKEYLKPDPERLYPRWHPKAGQFGSPKLFIVRSACPSLVNELQTYMWEERKEGKDENFQEKPRKFNDHAADATRYLVMAVGKRMAPWIMPPPTDEVIGLYGQKAIQKHAFTQRANEPSEYGE